MKISPQNIYLFSTNHSPLNKVSFKGAAIVRSNNTGDTFQKRSRTENKNKIGILQKLFGKKQPKIHPAYKAFLEKEDKFTISDYLSLSAEDKLAIKQEIGLENLLPACLSINFSKGMKEFLDKKYGENAYVFVSIGTSPSLIAKVFECMGVETKYLPISKLGSKDSQTYNTDATFLKYKYDKYGKFLKTQKITKDVLERGSKKYIFYDYTLSGETLKRFERIMKEKFSLPADKIEFRSLNKDLINLFNGKIIIDDNDAVRQYIRDMLHHGGAQEFSSIRGLPITRIDIANYEPAALAKHEELKPKIFNFLIMDNLNSSKLLKENPLNSNSL